ncbi:MAG TPA: hypothetical protein VI278_16445 [Nitrososphaeraceae archaeon]
MQKNEAYVCQRIHSFGVCPLVLVILVVGWLMEAYYLRMFLQLSHIPHYTTLQKFAARISGTILAKIR